MCILGVRAFRPALRQRKGQKTMRGLGTIINAGAIIAGGLLGLAGDRFLKKSMQDTLMKATGVCVMFIGIGGAIEEMMTVSGQSLVSGSTMMMIGSMVIGSLIGEILNIEFRIEQFGEWLKARTGNSQDPAFVDAFVTASLTVCIGAMAVVGAIQDGLSGDYSVLAVKAVLDLIIVLVMTSFLGKGCIFSAIPVALFQGVITLAARLVEPLMTEQALGNLSLIGSLLIFCVGVNLIWEKKLKVANMLPAILVAVVWAFVLK